MTIYKIPNFFSKHKEGLPLLADENTKVLIIGTFPGEKSLLSKEYYNDKSNDFWKILDKVYEEKFSASTYESRVEKLLKLKIGIWDVYHQCQRKTSKDKDIVGWSLNYFKDLKISAPSLETVCLNGKLASKYENNFSELGYRVFTLPSTSGANRRNQLKRLNDWKEGLK